MVHGHEYDGDDEIYLVWTEVVSGHSDIYFTQTLQSGTQWRTTTTNVSNTVGASGHPKVGFVSGGPGPVSDDRVVVVWDDTSLGDREILFSRKRGAGPFEAPVNVSSSAGLSSNPSVAMPKVGLILVAWEEELGLTNNEIFVARSIDGGVSFGTPVNVSNTAAGSFLPAIAAINDQESLVVWTESGTPTKVLAARSTDGGMSFGPPFEVSGGAGVTGAATLWSDPPTVIAAWSDLNDIYEARSTDSGMNFAAPINVSDDPGISTSPTAARGSNFDLVAWEDVTSNEIFLAKVSLVGPLLQTMIATVNLSGADASAGGSGGSFPPAIAVILDTAYVAWSDNTQSTSIDLVVKTHTF